MNIAVLLLIFLLDVKNVGCFRAKEDFDLFAGLRLEPVSEFFKELMSDEQDDEQVDDRSLGASTGRYLEITSYILQLIYSLIGQTGHSAKSLELARQMNVSRRHTVNNICLEHTTKWMVTSETK